MILEQIPCPQADRGRCCTVEKGSPEKYFKFLSIIFLTHLRQHVGEGCGEDHSPAEAGEAGHDEAAPGTLRQVNLKGSS